MVVQVSELTNILRAGSFLIESTSAQADVRQRLISRLESFHAAFGPNRQRVDTTLTLEQAQLETAQGALEVVENVQQILHRDELESLPTGEQLSDSKEAEGAPVIGTRDLAQLRTLLSITFKWGVEPLLDSIVIALPSKPTAVISSGPKIIDLTATPEDYKRLSSFILKLLSLLLPEGPHRSIPQTLITTTLLHRHLADLLRPSIVLGWLPKSLSTEATPTVNEIRPMIMRLFEILAPSQTITALGTVLSSSLSTVWHVRKTCGSLLSRQLLRPEGVLGLLSAVFGEGENSEDSVPLQKLEHVAKVLAAVPQGMKTKEYFAVIGPRILAVFSSSSPITYQQAAAFCLGRMMGDSSYPYQDDILSTVSPILHEPFLRLSAPISDIETPSTLTLTPASALSTLTAFILHADPSPVLISSLLTPIVTSLYALSALVDKKKTADPVLKENVKGLLATWGRVTMFEECLSGLWRIVEGEGGQWQVDIAGGITRVERADELQLSLLTPEDIRRAAETGEMDFDSNLLNLRPDPVQFVQYLKDIERKDVSSALFVRALDAYRDLKSDNEADPMRTMLYLQLIIQMQSKLTNAAGSSDVLRKPEHILSFVKHALASTEELSGPGEPASNPQATTLKMQDLRIVPEDHDELSDDVDSDDETPDTEGALGEAEMTETAVNLLLAVLEANEELSARTAPVLNDIFALLEPLTSSHSNIQALAKEARMVMTARLASTSNNGGMAQSRTSGEEKAQETYQKALKLLQDPILPVRAHGLLLLRQLVSPQPSGSSADSVIDRALIPSIISIFMQAIQDEDSYMFLNAVQGLAAMVDSFGKDVLRSLIVEYSGRLDGLGGTTMTDNEVEKRIRVGEALGQVIRRCGDALSLYADILVPPLMHVFRLRHIPTLLRTSALSLLSDGISTSSIAFLPYTTGLSESMVDLLQIETIPEATVARERQPAKSLEPEAESARATIDAQPTLVDAKLPAFRRAALHLLGSLFRTSAMHVYETSNQDTSFSPAQAKRARTILSYVASTDQDSVVRVMAREVIEGLDQLNTATMGL